MTQLTNALLTSAVIATAGAAAAARPATDQTGYHLASTAHVSIAQDRQITLKAHPGVITDQPLQREAGGSRLRYSFDIKASGKTDEVGAVAQTGKVLENGAEGPHPD